MISYVQGRIACANVLSDLYAMGVVDCHNMLMLLAGHLDHDDEDDDHEDAENEDDDDDEHEKIEAERDAVIPLMMQVLHQIIMSG